MRVKQILSRLINSEPPVYSKNESDVDKKESFAQVGEDLIVSFIFEQLSIIKPSYLDIGAHHPTNLNNTYLFYNRGSRGVNIEPDPTLIEAFRTTRPEDLNLSLGIGLDVNSVDSDFYIMSARTLNTFSKAEAERVQNFGTYKIENVVKIPTLNVNTILEMHFNGLTPDFVTIDVEGLDYKIITMFDFERYRPHVFCIETLSYNEDKKERKLNEIIDYMHSVGYFTYADTYINTIFVNQETWNNR